MAAKDAVYPGAPGAFSAEACRKLAPDRPQRAVPTFAQVVDQLVAHEASVGVLPLENSTAGPVPGVDALIARGGLRIERRLRLPIRLHLLALPGVSLGEVALIRSHPMALRQCRVALKALGIETETAENTALAAQQLARDGRCDCAVIASAEAAAAYGLVPLATGIEDGADNTTEFGLLARAGG